MLLNIKYLKKVREEPTIEFHCDLALFLEVHDGIGIVVCIPNHYLNILLRGRSWYKENREQSTQMILLYSGTLRNKTDLSVSVFLGLMLDDRLVISPNTGDC